MMNIRDHFVDVALYGGSDRDELIDNTDVEATEEEEEEEDDDDEDEDDDNDNDDEEGDDDDADRRHDGDTECEEIQFTYCHSSAANAVEAVDNELSTAVFPQHAASRSTLRTPLCRGGHCECVCEQCHDPVGTTGTCCPPLGRRHRPRPQLLWLGGRIAVLFAAAFGLLIGFALYLEQLSTSDEQFRRLAARAQHSRQQQQFGDESPADEAASVFGLVTMPARLNGLGALIFVNGVVFYVLCAASGLCCWWLNWWSRDGVHLLQFPMPANRLFYVSNLAGAAGAAIFICSYQRVACHLQDPLKGFCLAFAIVFYFLFCKKVMGLQKIFAATTAVVGLLIAVDYGLCDSFRCRGVDVPPGVAATGWQSRAVWTMGYIVALAAWTLQWLLLEGDVVTTFPAQRPAHPSNRLLSTVSRLVAMSTAADDGGQPPKCRRNVAADPADTVWAKPPLAKRRAKPKAVLVAAWLHGMASMAALTSGLIDFVPGTPDVPSISVNEFIYDTYQTVLCHTNLCYFDGWPHHVTTTVSPADPTLTTTTPPTIEQRSRRSLTNDTKLHEVVINGIVHLNLASDRRHHSDTGNRMDTEVQPPEPTVHTNETRRINTEKYWKKYRNYVKRKRTMPVGSAAGSVEHSRHDSATSSKSAVQPAGAADAADIDDAEIVSNFTLNWPIMRTGLLFSVAYALFLVCSIQFLLDTESAVFTVAAMSLALPVAGIFWSLFELKTADHIATIVWAPEVTGELICSVLGTPIIVLGLCLFAAAHLDDVTMRQRMYRAVAS